MHVFLLLLALLFIGCDDTNSTADAGDAGPTDAATTRPFNLNLVDDPLTPGFLGVWGNRDDDLYFAGGLGPAARALWHFDGQTFTAETVPEGPMLWWVWGQGDAVWSCGAEGHIIHRAADGTWSEEPTGLDEKAVLWGLWGSGPNDIWAVGGTVRRGGPKGILLRSTGDGTWSRVEDPALPDNANLYKVWGSGPDDVHIVGELGIALHWDGATYTRFETPISDLIFTIHGQPGGLILAVGGLGQGRIIRWNDGEWVDDNPPRVSGLNGVFVRSDGTALVTGERGLMLERSVDGHWIRLQPDRPQFGPRTLHAAWIGDSTWVVGGNLTMITDGIIATDHTPAPSGTP